MNESYCITFCKIISLMMCRKIRSIQKVLGFKVLSWFIRSNTGSTSRLSSPRMPTNYLISSFQRLSDGFCQNEMRMEQV